MASEIPPTSQVVTLLFKKKNNNFFKTALLRYNPPMYGSVT